MVAGIDRFLLRETDLAAAHRGERWKRDFGSAAAYEKSIATNRENLRRMIGAVDPRLPSPTPELVATLDTPAEVAETDRFTARAVRWPVLEGVFGEGLLLQPKGRIRARVVAIPDADQTPELICGLARGLAPEAQFARRLAENGCEVLVLTLVNREDTWSGNEKLKRFTNQPHREWIYRQAYELGRHLIGYEVQKVIAAVDWFERPGPAAAKVKVGVAGLRRRRVDRVLRRGRGSAHSSGARERLLRGATTPVERTDLPECFSDCCASSAMRKSPASSRPARWWWNSARRRGSKDHPARATAGRRGARRMDDARVQYRRRGGESRARARPAAGGGPLD
jgi:hypothetical protein